MQTAVICSEVSTVLEARGCSQHNVSSRGEHGVGEASRRGKHTNAHTP